MWWRLYLIFITITLLIGSVSMFSLPIKHLYMVFVDIGVMLVMLAGLYSYVFHKKILTPRFWKYFFWGNIVYLGLSIAHGLFPDTELSRYLSYLISVETESSGAIVDTLSAALVLPLYYVIFQLSRDRFSKILKKEKKTTKKEVKGNFTRWSLIVSILFIAEVILFLLYAAILSFISLPEESGIAYMILAILIIAVPFPLLKLYQFPHSKLGLSLFGVFMVLMGVSVLFGYATNLNTPRGVPAGGEEISSGTLSDKELFEAINKKRRENNINELGYEKSTCALARIRVEDVNEQGIGVFGSAASFQRAIDKVFEEDATLDIYESPSWYLEFLTYQETADEAVAEWMKYETKALFTDEEYHVGCVAEKAGFAVVVVGYMDSSLLEEDTQSFPFPEESKGPY